MRCSEREKNMEMMMVRGRSVEAKGMISMRRTSRAVCREVAECGCAMSNLASSPYSMKQGIRRGQAVDFLTPQNASNTFKPTAQRG